MGSGSESVCGCAWCWGSAGVRVEVRAGLGLGFVLRFGGLAVGLMKEKLWNCRNAEKITGTTRGWNFAFF